MRNTPLSIKFLPVLMIMTLFAAMPLHAGEPTDQIRRTTDAILAVVRANPGDSEEVEAKRREAIRKEVDKRFDWESMARRSLGRHWRGKTEAQLNEFTKLFSKLLENTYMDKIEGYSGEEVLYENERRDDEYARVFVKIKTRTDREIAVEYRTKLRDKDKQWLVYDIVIEGVSLVKNYRSQFESLLARGSFDEMLKKIENKLEKNKDA